MSEATVFESATDYLEGIDLPPTPFDAALQELTQRVDITVPQTFQTPLGTMATSSLIVKEPLRLPILSLPLTLVVGANDEDHPVAFSAL